jgi:hypothetical protein
MAGRTNGRSDKCQVRQMSVGQTSVGQTSVAQKSRHPIMLGREGCKFFPLFVNFIKKIEELNLKTFSEILSKLMIKTCPK